MKQRSFADLQLEQYRKLSRISLKLEKIDALVDWQAIFELVKVVDKTQQGLGGAPHKDLLSKVKMLFLQCLYNLSDPELEDQVNDRLSFQKFSGIDGFAKSPARADFSFYGARNVHLLRVTCAFCAPYALKSKRSVGLSMPSLILITIIFGTRLVAAARH